MRFGEVEELMMEGPSSKSRAPKANGEEHLAVEIPKMAHQIRERCSCARYN